VHSNVGFLQADPKGVRLIREAAEMQPFFKNVRLAGNCEEFVQWVKEAYHKPCWLLPNLYNLGDNPVAPMQNMWKGGHLRIGSFGAVRPLKNTMTAAACALQLSNKLNAIVEFWMSANRVEGGANCVINAIEEMLAGTHVKIVPSPWEPWPQFRNTMAKMHLHLQPSYTESFNLTVADAISVGVPSVVSPAIGWTPKNWQADPDDVGDMVHVAKRLLKDPNSIKEGFKALEDYIEDGLEHWERFLGLET
jgi:glycosyltransferase involved in cell wall biosynthesis